ncbi:MAG: hypothetical protein EA384_13885 [Spirochaetaceae bacterium]|nr:MAG: hypothetical protein EA384_13885 [Spirochaetaceae bacterium]
MNSELFSFSILAAILGMGVVFLFLGILSFLMHAIKVLFGEKPAAQSAGRRIGEDGNRSGSQHGESPEEWVVAAAAAFLIEEELDSKRSAAAWQPQAGPAVDSWLSMPRV